MVLFNKKNRTAFSKIARNYLKTNNSTLIAETRSNSHTGMKRKSRHDYNANQSEGFYLAKTYYWYYRDVLLSVMTVSDGAVRINNITDEYRHCIPFNNPEINCYKKHYSTARRIWR